MIRQESLNYLQKLEERLAAAEKALGESEMTIQDTRRRMNENVKIALKEVNNPLFNALSHLIKPDIYDVEVKKHKENAAWLLTNFIDEHEKIGHESTLIFLQGYFMYYNMLHYILDYVENSGETKEFSKLQKYIMKEILS